MKPWSNDLQNFGLAFDQDICWERGYKERFIFLQSILAKFSFRRDRQLFDLHDFPFTKQILYLGRPQLITRD